MFFSKPEPEAPEEIAWQLSEHNPQLELDLTSDTAHKGEETQPYRRPTYLDEIQSWSD